MLHAQESHYNPIITRSETKFEDIFLIVHFHALSLSTQIDSLLFGPDEWEHETSGGINNCLESSSLLSMNVTFQKRACGIGLVTRREGLYRSENKQLKTFC